MTRNGKIARLPDKIRNQLNRRLQDGEPGNLLVEWLNKLPAVKKVLAQQFDSHPISEQSLSEWRNGGYQDWLHHQESIEFIEKITEQGRDLQLAARGGRIAEGVSSWLSAEFLTLAHKLLEEKADPQERWHCLCEILGQLSHLRRDDHSAERIGIKREKFDREVKQEESSKPYSALLNQAQGLFHQIVLKQLEQDFEEDEARKNPTQSDSIRLNPT